MANCQAGVNAAMVAQSPLANAKYLHRPAPTVHESVNVLPAVGPAVATDPAVVVEPGHDVQSNQQLHHHEHRGRSERHYATEHLGTALRRL